MVNSFYGSISHLHKIIYALRKGIPDKDRSDRNALIGELRSIFASACIRALKPDIVILDEFQRFKHLLDGENQMSELAQELFNYHEQDQKVKVILLSATPYKMYTMHHEKEKDDHYQDFLKTLRFLFSTAEELNTFRYLLKEYRKHLYNLKPGQSNELIVVKKQIEDMLRQVMVRTERLSVSTDQNGMVSDITVKKAQITAKDLTSFVTIDQIAQLLDLGDQTEYWKSAPYILNYMDSYILKKKFKQNFTACSNLATILERNRNALISWQQIEKYKKLDPQNYKLRDLISKNIDAGWQLLWIPPSLPYYQTNGIYACKEARNFTKSLVFSAWQVVPKVVSAICSYETERRMVKKYDESVPVQRKIYSYKELNKKHVQLLRFSNQEGRHTGMPVLTLLYPSLTLGKKVDLLSIIKDLSHLGSIPTIEEVSVAVSCKIQLLLEQANIFSYSNSSQEDERWYWASLALLERFYYQDQASQWQTYGVQKDNEYGAEPYLWRTIIKGRTQADEDSRFAEHVDHFYEAINNPDQLQLGSPPKDLINV